MHKVKNRLLADGFACAPQLQAFDDWRDMSSSIDGFDSNGVETVKSCAATDNSIHVHMPAKFGAIVEHAFITFRMHVNRIARDASFERKVITIREIGIARQGHLTLEFSNF